MCVCVCDLYDLYDSVCECVCADNGEIFHNCHHERRATLLTHNCLECCIVPRIQEIFTFFRKLWKYNLWPVFIRSWNFKKFPEIFKNPQNPQESPGISCWIKKLKEGSTWSEMTQTDTNVNTLLFCSGSLPFSEQMLQNFEIFRWTWLMLFGGWSTSAVSSCLRVSRRGRVNHPN